MIFINLISLIALDFSLPIDLIMSMVENLLVALIVLMLHEEVE